MGKPKIPSLQIFDTICDSTEKRQREVARLAEAVDAVIVVGGHHSGNTQRLAEVVRSKGKRLFILKRNRNWIFRLLRNIKPSG